MNICKGLKFDRLHTSVLCMATTGLAVVSECPKRADKWEITPMCWQIPRGNLTKREREMYEALTEEWQSADDINKKIKHLGISNRNISGWIRQLKLRGFCIEKRNVGNRVNCRRKEYRISKGKVRP